MNAISNLLKQSSIKYTSNFDPEKLTDVLVKECKGKNGTYYKWFATLHGEVQEINLTRNNKFILNVFCVDCDKQILKDVKLSSLFTFSVCNQTTLKHSEKFAIRCKACSNRKNGRETKDKAKQTCLEKHGYEYSFMRPGFYEHSHRVKQLKYGANYKQIAQLKGQQTYYKKNGFTHNMKNPECVKKHAEKRKNTILSRTEERRKEIEIKRLAGYTKTGVNTLFGKNNKNKQSKISTDFYTNLVSHLKYAICTEELIGNYIVDFLIPNVCIIEFFGTFWHADPRKYKPHSVLKRGNNSKHHILASKIWERDHKKIAFLVEETKLPCIIVWEDDYKRNKFETIQNVIKQISKIQNTHFLNE